MIFVRKKLLSLAAQNDYLILPLRKNTDDDSPGMTVQNAPDKALSVLFSHQNKT